jgi:hypothetical protein
MLFWDFSLRTNLWGSSPTMPVNSRHLTFFDSLHCMLFYLSSPKRMHQFMVLAWS